MLRRKGLSAAFSCAFLLGLALVVSSASAAPARSPARTPLGAWLTAKGNAVVRIVRCGDALCGEIAGIARRPGTPMPTDVEGRPQCGLVVIRDERPEGDGSWVGTVTDPRDGASFGARLRVDAAGNLRLRGFFAVPLLGETQTWHRFTGELGAGCRMS